MKTVNFKGNFKGIDGLDLEGAEMHKSLGNALAAATKGDAVKMWSLATRIYAGEDVDLDPSDLEMIKEFVKNNEGFTNLAKAQIIEILMYDAPKEELKVVTEEK
jgi:valyl-tRNA synthetase